MAKLDAKKEEEIELLASTFGRSVRPSTFFTRFNSLAFTHTPGFSIRFHL